MSLPCTILENASGNKSEKWILDLVWSRRIPNGSQDFFSFTKTNGMVKVGSNGVCQSMGYLPVRIFTVQ